MTERMDSYPARHMLVIRLAPGTDFDAQREIVKSVGASYDGAAKHWYVPLETVVAGQAEGINDLFKLAREHGTFVMVEAPLPTD